MPETEWEKGYDEGEFDNQEAWEIELKEVLPSSMDVITPTTIAEYIKRLREGKQR